MERLFIEGKNETPGILFDKTEGVFKIEGVSIPEDSIAFFVRVFEWINAYIQEPNSETKLEFYLEYCNTASSKQMYEILALFKKVIDKNCKIIIEWHYDIYDSDMKTLGLSFSQLLNIPFEYISDG